MTADPTHVHAGDASRTDVTVAVVAKECLPGKV